MVNNYSESKESINYESTGGPRYIGVGAVNIVAINPDNAKLRSFGWNLAEDAKEREYVREIDRNGTKFTETEVCFMAKLVDLDKEPVIPMRFRIRREVMLNSAGDKCKIIDKYGRTAWATKDEVKNKKIPVYTTKDGSTMPANISSDYALCHYGEEEIIKFLFKYLNISPFNIFDKKTKGYVPNPKPGILTIDDWKKLCDGDMSELRSYISLLPDNKVKVIFGVKTDDDNKVYQTFIRDTYLSNASIPRNGAYELAVKAIEKAKKPYTGKDGNTYSDPAEYSAGEIKLYEQKPTTTHEEWIDPNNNSNSNQMSELDQVFSQQPTVENDLPY